MYDALVACWHMASSALQGIIPCVCTILVCLLMSPRAAARVCQQMMNQVVLPVLNGWQRHKLGQKQVCLCALASKEQASIAEFACSAAQLLLLSSLLSCVSSLTDAVYASQVARARALSLSISLSLSLSLSQWPALKMRS